MWPCLGTGLKWARVAIVYNLGCVGCVRRSTRPLFFSRSLAPLSFYPVADGWPVLWPGTLNSWNVRILFFLFFASSPRAAQQPLLADEPRRSRRTASAQLVVSTDHTHSTDITIEADDDKPASPTQPAVLPDLESPLSPPSASSTPSQSATFGRTRSATVASPLRDDEQKPSSIGPQRVRSATLSSPSASTAARTNLQKRKRSRVTPEQLAHLERVFAQDRSPTAARRKEISEQLGMQERQTQIWFQNRSVISFRLVLG